MQSDKLPKMPDQRWDAAFHGAALYGLYDSAEAAADAAIEIGGSATAIFTAQQMQDYALAARKSALEEAAKLCEDDGMIAGAKGYERFARDSAECGAKIRALMEQDA